VSAAEDVLARPVFIAGAYKPFAAFTLNDVQARASELRQAAQAGPLARVGGIARAWGELARALSAAGVETVGELDPDIAADLGRKAWVVPPSFL